MFGFVLAADGRTAYGALMSRRVDGGEIVVAKPVVAQFELDTGRIVRSVEVPWGVAHLVAVRGGAAIYAFGQDLYKIDTTGPDLRVVETVPMFDKGMNILPFWDYSFDNGGVASMNYYTAKHMGLLLVDQASGDIRDLPIAGDPAMAYSVVLAPDRKRAYAVMDDLTVIDLAKRRYVASVPIREGTCYGVNVSSDGRKVYVGGAGSTVTVYDAKTLKPIKVLQMASDGMDIRRIAF
jgi:DNA-binding beta-propeller fold protein YncE